MLVDTGSDISIIDAELVEPLGIKLESGVKFSFGGIIGLGSGHRHFINIEIGGIVFSNIPVIFASTIAPEGYGILGHEGLFDKLRLVFEYGKKEIEITKKELG